MNKELLLRVADAIEHESELGFDMTHFRHNSYNLAYEYSEAGCKTTACIAGHAVFIHSPALFRKSTTNIERVALKVLDMCNDPRAEKLFFHNRVSRKEAAEVIRHLVKTDEVEWNPLKRQWRVAWLKILGRDSNTCKRTQVRDDSQIVALKNNLDCPSIVGIEIIPTGGVVSHDIRVEDVSKPIIPVLDKVD